jgi:glutathione S-transferase
MLAQCAKLDAFLLAHAPRSLFLHDAFGWAEAVYTPFFWRFEFLAHYENFELPADSGFERVRAWRAACQAYPAAQQVTAEEVVKCYYDYSLGVGNGALPEGRMRSSFVFEPHWRPRALRRRHDDGLHDVGVRSLATGKAWNSDAFLGKVAIARS